MSAVLIALFVSLIGCLFLIRYQHLHGHITGDTDFKGVQKFHDNPVPRIGGIPIFLGLSCALMWRWTDNTQIGLFASLLLLSSLPCFLTGLVEDITKKVGAKERLLATMISSAVAGELRFLGLIGCFRSHFFP
jgi:UDP-N-acetylmuramyl pentapeptide phosphotransferase/UDP-N-acetylglucosamine-1-phosphate transferase